MTLAAPIAAPAPLGWDEPATPLLTVDLGVVGWAHRVLRRALPGVDLHYAVKANPDPAVLAALAAQGCRWDVASPGELEAVLAVDPDPGHVSYGNTVKKAVDIVSAHAAGVRRFAFDCAAELDKLTVCGPESTLLVRLATSGKGADWALGTKFGCREEVAGKLLLTAARIGHSVGVCFHVGSQQRDVDAWDAPLAAVARLRATLRRSGVDLAVVDLGGGFPAVGVAPAAPPVHAFGDAIAAALARHLGDDVPELIASLAVAWSLTPARSRPRWFSCPDESASGGCTSTSECFRARGDDGGGDPLSDDGDARRGASGGAHWSGGPGGPNVRQRRHPVCRAAAAASSGSACGGPAADARRRGVHDVVLLRRVQRLSAAAGGVPVTTVTTVTRSGLGHALRSRPFRRLLLAHGSGTVAQGVVTLAVGVAVHERTGSGVWTSVTVALAFAPYALFSSRAGVLADRRPRSTVLATSCGVRAGLGAVIAASLLVGAPIPVLVGLTAAMAVCATPSFPALAAATRQCVPDADLPAANALATSVENVTWIAAPGVFGVLTLAQLSSSGVVTCSALLFVGAAASAGGVRLPCLARADVPTRWRDLEAGVAAVVLDPSVRRPMMLAVLDNFLYGFLIVAVALLAEETGGEELGRLNATLAIGALAATAVVNRMTTRGCVRVLPLVMLLAFTVCLWLLGTVGVGPLAVLLLAAAGAATLMAEVAAVTLRQRAADDCTLARVFGVYDQVNVGAIAAGSFLAGPLAATLGARGALSVAAASGTALALASLLPTVGAREARATFRDPTEETRRSPAPVVDQWPRTVALTTQRRTPERIHR